MITDLSEMIVERLVAFWNKNNTLPTRILFFRKGVSETQFLTVLAHELPEIKAAFAQFSTPIKSYQPKLTIVVANKGYGHQLMLQNLPR